MNEHCVVNVCMYMYESCRYNHISLLLVVLPRIYHLYWFLLLLLQLLFGCEPVQNVVKPSLQTHTNCSATTNLNLKHAQTRSMSSGRRVGFLENIVSNLREGFTKDEKLKVGTFCNFGINFFGGSIYDSRIFTFFLCSTNYCMIDWLQENLKAFRDQTKKLEESDALKQARKKYVSCIGCSCMC